MSRIREVASWVESNRELILSTISDLIRIRTENLPPGGNEKPGQEYLHGFASRFLPADCLDLFEVDDVPGIREHPLFFPTIDGVERVYRDRPVLSARLPGLGGGPSLALSGHMDTMPTYGKTWEVFPDPFSGQVRDDWMYGRGAIDMKAGTACGFLALRCLHELGVRLKGDVYAESVVDEENGGVNGTLAARLRRPDIDFAILSEPSSLAVGIESIGGSDFKASVAESGPGGIGTDVQLPNPIYRLARTALALERYDARLRALPPPDTYERDMHIRLLTYQLASGGRGYLDSGAVPTDGHIIFWLETYARTGAEEAARNFMEFMRRELGEQMPRIEQVIRFLDGHRTDRDHPALGSLRRAYGALGLEHVERGIPFATDAFAFRRASKTDVAIVGPIGKNLHGTDECVEIGSVLKLLKVMVLTAIDYCG